MTPDQALGALLFTVIAIFVAFFGYHLWDARKIAVEDRQLRADWEQEMTKVILPPWNGETWDWPETGLARYLNDPAWPLDDPGEEGTAPLEPADDDNDADAFIDHMRQRTDAFIAFLDEPLAAS